MRGLIVGVVLCASACAPRTTDPTKPPDITGVGETVIDSWTDAEEQDFGLLVGYEILARHGSTRYVPAASPDGEAVDDPRRVMLQHAQEAAKSRPLERYLDEVLDRVAAQGARDQKALDHRGRSRDFVIFVVETDEAYSCATPGGFVFITTGLLGELHSEMELAFILATEVAHVDREHALDVARLHLHASRTTQKDVLGDPQVAQKMVDSVMKALFETGLGTTRDLEADRLALLYMTGADYDSTGPIDALERLHAMQSKPNGRVLKASHPAAEKRIAALRPIIERLEPPYLDGDVNQEAYEKRVLSTPEIRGVPEDDEPPDFDEPPEDPDSWP